MDNLPLLKTELMICPICKSRRFLRFDLISSDGFKTKFSCECENKHSGWYSITFASGALISGFYIIPEEKKFEYSEYLKTEEWKHKSKMAKAAAGWRCQLCNTLGDNYTLHTHHRTYERVGKEDTGDLIVLCADCHAKFHDVAQL